MIDITYPDSVQIEHAQQKHIRDLMAVCRVHHDAIVDALNVLSRPHSRDEFMITYNRQQIHELMQKL